MLSAFLTTFCWAFAGFGSSRIARHYGSALANGMRLFWATLLLGGWVWAGGGWRLPPGWVWFALSGLLHLAIGDVALFAVYRRLGPRIGVLAVSSLAPMAAMSVEWLSLGTRIGGGQALLAAGVLGCVLLAVAPRERQHLTAKEIRLGAWAAFFASVAQGASAAVTRIGWGEVEAAGVAVNPLLPTLLRCAFGGLGVWLWLGVRRLRGAEQGLPADLLPHRRIGGPPWVWLAVSTLLGPMLGVYFLMQALSAYPSGIVQAVLSTLPVVMLPVAWFFDGNAPSRRSAIFGTLAVALAVKLAVASA